MFTVTPPPQVPYPHTFLNTSREVDSTTFLGSLFNALQPFPASRGANHSILNLFVIILVVWSDPGSHAVQCA